MCYRLDSSQSVFALNYIILNCIKKFNVVSYVLRRRIHLSQYCASCRNLHWRQQSPLTSRQGKARIFVVRRPCRSRPRRRQLHRQLLLTEPSRSRRWPSHREASWSDWFQTMTGSRTQCRALFSTTTLATSLTLLQSSATR